MLTIDKIKIGDEIYNIGGDNSGNVDLSEYVTETEMNEAISNIQSMSVNYDSANKSIIFN